MQLETEEKCLSLAINNFSANEGDLIHNLSDSMDATEFSMLANDVLHTDDGQHNSGKMCIIYCVCLIFLNA